MYVSLGQAAITGYVIRPYCRHASQATELKSFISNSTADAKAQGTKEELLVCMRASVNRPKNTATYNLRKAKLKGFKLKRTVHGSVDLRELPPVVTICAGYESSHWFVSAPCLGLAVATFPLFASATLEGVCFRLLFACAER